MTGIVAPERSLDRQWKREACTVRPVVFGGAGRVRRRRRRWVRGQSGCGRYGDADTDAGGAERCAHPRSGREPFLQPHVDRSGNHDRHARRSIVRADVSRNSTLLVWLPGQGAAPGAYTTISAFAASVGYHVVSVDYPNANAAATYCVSDMSCYGNVWWAKWDGRSGPEGITPANSISNRVTKMLAYLSANFPSEN